MIKLKNSLLLLLVTFYFTACTVSKIYPVAYYEQNKETLHDIEQLYAQAAGKGQLALVFADMDFTKLSLEFRTDTVRYIYDFNYREAWVNDSLYKFGYDTSLVQKIITDMRTIKCTWINTLDYYVEGNKKLLLFVSVPVKQFSLFPTFQKSKYYLFNFYKQPQYYDEEGRLLDKKKLSRLRKVNNEVFLRITDKVCYTVAGKFR